MNNILLIQDLICLLVRQKKISIIPIIPGEKRPGEFERGKWRGMMDWERFADRLPTAIELEHWGNWPLSSLGVLTGRVSNLIALDFDNKPEIGEEIQGFIPKSPVRKRGAKGLTAFYRFNGEQNRKWIVEGETVLELLSDGRQTLIPPSLHPSGKVYEWIGEAELSTFDLEKLPILTEEHFKKIDELFAKYSPTRPARTVQVSERYEDATLSDVREALKHVSPDDYHTWVKIGMGIHSEFPGTDGFDLWDSWSRGSAKYDPLPMVKKWASFRGVTSVNIASVFYEAQQAGFQNNGHGRVTYSVNPIREIEPPKEAPDGIEQLGKLALPMDLIQSAPGLPGRIAAWINETSIFVQPALALGASLAAVGALKAHRVRTESDVRTNLYAVGVAPSGSGKGRAMEQIEALLDAAGLTNLFSGEPVSDSALLKSLRNNKGRRLLQWDELGLALQEMTSQRAASYKSAILSVMMKLFSKANQNFHGKEYADHDDKMKRADIDQPCLCVYGASTPSRFYNALSSSHVVDGFASRLLIFETADPYPRWRDIGITDIPPSLISEVQKIEQMPTNSNPRGNLDQVIEIRPKIMFLDDEAKTLMAEARDEFYNNRAKYEAKSEGLSAVWSRAGEHMMKIALIVEDGEVISKHSVNWARGVVMFCTKNLCEVIMNRVADNEYQRSLNRLLDIVRKAGSSGISHTELYNRTRFLRTFERKDILENLIEGGQLEPVTIKGASKNSISYIAKPTWRG